MILLALDSVIRMFLDHCHNDKEELCSVSDGPAKNASTSLTTKSAKAMKALAS